MSDQSAREPRKVSAQRQKVKVDVASSTPGASIAGAPQAIEKLLKLQAEAAAASTTGVGDAVAGEMRGEAEPPVHHGPAKQSPADGEREAGLLAILSIEAEARDAKELGELYVLMANEPRRLLKARQIFVLRRISGSLQVVAVSALPAVDRTSPLVRFIERAVERLSADGHGAGTTDFHLSAYCDENDETTRAYPMQDALWIALRDRDGGVLGGLLATREQAWTEREIVVAKRLGGTFQHALLALARVAPLWAMVRPRRRTVAWLAAAMMALGLLPVSLTTLAPVEVVPRDPFVISAPIEGVIDEIPINANSKVEKGELLVKFDDTTLRNKYEVAEREVLVGLARLKTTTQLAFGDERGRHELAVSRADLVVKTAERDFARDLLAKTQIRAPRAGIAVLGEKKELIGKPMLVGERILEIADPDKVELRIDVPVADAIILKEGAAVKVLLDSNPLSAIAAQIVRSDYHARQSDAGVLSFRVIAELASSAPIPRLGARGSAQIYGDKVILGFYLLRRPFSKLRQWTGL